MNLKEIAKDNVHGSETLTVELVKSCLDAFLNGIDFSKDLEYIKNKKSEMTQLINIIYMISKFDSAEQYRNLLRDLNQSVKSSVLNTKNILKGNVVTISWSKLVRDAIMLNKDKIDEINVLESRPKNEGAKFAEYLSDSEFRVKLYVDAAIYHAVNEESVILVGMDAIFRDLSIANKVGTYSLALASAAKGSKFYTIGTKYKIAREYYHFINHPFREIYKKNLNTQNYYFDITSSRFIDKYIMDFGIFEKSNLNSFRDILSSSKENS